MKKIIKMMAIAIVSLSATIFVVSCSDIKSSEDLVGTWKMVESGLNGPNEYHLWTLNNDGRGEWMLVDNKGVDDYDTIEKWFYSKDTDTITIMIGDDYINLAISEVSDGGNTIKGVMGNSKFEKVYNFTMTRVR